MTTQVNPKVRFVRCPKCLQVLAEVSEISLYKCGECGTILQAKIKKMKANHSEISSLETDSAAKAGDDFSKEEGTICSKHYLTSSPKEESLPGKDNMIYVDKHGERSAGLSEDGSVANDSCPAAGEYTEEYDQNYTPRKITQNIRSTSYVELFGSSLPAYASPELVLKHGNAVSSPTTTSHYAYYGSETSNDDQLRVHVPRPPRRKCKEDGSRAKNMLNTEANYWAPSSSVSLDGCMSRLPLTSRELHSNRRTEIPSVYQLNFPTSYPDILPSDSLYSATDKLYLLRTVHELQDQLNTIQLPEISRSQRFPAGVMEGKLATFYYGELTPMDRDLINDPENYHLWHDQEKYSNERAKFTRRAFPGEAKHYRSPLYCSCLSGCPHDCHYAGQLPSHALHYKNDRIFAGSSTPQRYLSPELMSRPNEMNKFQMTKKHLLPIAGGSPIVACYVCSELLQLPADFLLFKKRYHQLRCHNCSKVLKFSHVKRKHVVPYLPDASPAPPPSEAGGYTAATVKRNAAIIPHSSSCQHVEAVSCSDDYDYGQSLCKSFSTEEEEANSSFGLVERNRPNETVEDTKMKSFLRECMNKCKIKKPVEALEKVEDFLQSPMQTTKGSSEIEEIAAPSTNPPLHWLMGYATPNLELKEII